MLECQKAQMFFFNNQNESIENRISDSRSRITVLKSLLNLFRKFPIQKKIFFYLQQPNSNGVRNIVKRGNHFLIGFLIL